MKPSSFQTAIRLQFDCLVKRVIDTTVKDYQRELSRRATHEIAFSELPEQELSHVGITDDYDSDYSCFEVLGTKVKVITQASTRPPRFVIFATGFLEHGYRRFLERSLREEFGFEGTPIQISVNIREKKRRK